MRRFLSRLLLVSSAALMYGCAIQTFKAPDASANKGKKVSSSLLHFSIFYLTPAVNLDKLVDELSEQCGGGKVEGISLVETRRFWYIFGQSYHFALSGHCAE